MSGERPNKLDRWNRLVTRPSVAARKANFKRVVFMTNCSKPVGFTNPGRQR